LLKLLLVFAKIVITTLVFEKNANFFAENWQKSQKIVIITSTPDWANFRRLGGCLQCELFNHTRIPQLFTMGSFSKMTE
jgi:hypothetical protein